LILGFTQVGTDVPFDMALVNQCSFCETTLLVQVNSARNTSAYGVKMPNILRHIPSRKIPGLPALSIEVALSNPPFLFEPSKLPHDRQTLVVEATTLDDNTTACLRESATVFVA
jgi:hypothetical protein